MNWGQLLSYEHFITCSKMFLLIGSLLIHSLGYKVLRSLANTCMMDVFALTHIFAIPNKRIVQRVSNSYGIQSKNFEAAFLCYSPQ